MARPTVFKLSVLLLKEGESWAAQVLEYDIAAQGKTIKLASDALERTIVGQIVLDATNGAVPLSDIPQAPKRYWDQFFKDAERLDDRKSVRVPDEIPNRIVMEELRVC